MNRQGASDDNVVAFFFLGMTSGWFSATCRGRSSWLASNEVNGPAWSGLQNNKCTGLASKEITTSKSGYFDLLLSLIFELYLFIGFLLWFLLYSYHSEYSFAIWNMTSLLANMNSTSRIWKAISVTMAASLLRKQTLNFQVSIHIILSTMGKCIAFSRILIAKILCCCTNFNYV